MKTKELIKPLENRFTQLAKDAGTNMVFSKEAAFAVQALENNPQLQKCTMPSIQKAILNVALVGLSLNPTMKLAYLVPRKGQCCLDISYQGLIKILTDTGSVQNVYAEVVKEGDFFDISLGSNPEIIHKPAINGRGKTIGAYSVAFLNGGLKSICWMDLEELEKVRKTSVFSGDKSIWGQWTDEMYKKTVLKRHYKQLPKSERHEQIANAIDSTNEADGFSGKNNNIDELFEEIEHEEVVETKD